MNFWFTVTKSSKVFGIIFAVGMILIGVLMLGNYSATIETVEFIVSFIIFLVGIYKLIFFIVGKQGRSILGLVLSILLLFVSVRLLFHGDTQIYFDFMLIMCGFILINNSITKIFNVKYYRSAGLKWMWLILVGIVNTALAVTLFVSIAIHNPVVVFIEAVLLITDGGIFLAESIAAHVRPNQEEDMQDDIRILE